MAEREELLAVAGALYAVVPADFTAARSAAAARAKSAGDKALAGAVGRLRKPSTGAWAVNLLVRRESEQIKQVLAMADSLRSAAEALDGTELRSLTRQRRQLTGALTTRARQLAQESGGRLSGAVAEQVEDTLTAAMLEPEAAEAVRTGLLVTTLRVPSEEGYAAALALPDAIGTRAEPDEGPGLRVVPRDDSARRDAARDERDRAVEEVESATGDLAVSTGALEELQGRALQLRGEVDELQRRIADLEQQAEDVDDEVEAAEEARDEAQGAVDEAVAARESAQAALDAVET